MITIRGDHAVQLIRVSVMTTHPKDSSDSRVERGATVFVSFVRSCLYVAVILATIALAAYAIAAQLSPQYRADAIIRIDRADSPGGEKANREFLTAQQQLLRSRDLAQSAIQSLGLGASATALSALGGNSLISVLLAKIGLARDYAQVAPEERLLDTFTERVSVSVDDSRSVLTVTFTARDPQLAAAAANAIAAEYVALQRAVAREQIAESLSRFATEIDALMRQVTTVETKVEAYRRGIALLSRTEAPSPRQLRAVAQLSSELASLEEEAIRQRALLDSYERQDRDAGARQPGNVPAVQASVTSPAAPPGDTFFPRTAPITAVVAALAFLIMVAFVIAREQARRQQRRSVGTVSESEIVVSGQGQLGPHRFDERTVRRFASKVTPLPGLDAGEDLCAASDSVGRKLIGGGARRIAVITVSETSVRLRPLAAVALVRALARADRRPLLIDLHNDGADSRGMGVTGESPGFSALIAGDASFEQAIFRDRKSRAHFIASGRRPVAREERADESVELLVDALAQTYDHVVFDICDEMVEAICPMCDTIIIASDLDEDDPRLSLTRRRIRAHSTARLIAMNVDTEAVSMPAPGAVLRGEAA